MIWRTYNNELPSPENPLRDMAWLRYWQGLEAGGGTPAEAGTARAVGLMRIWRVFDWQPEAAESMFCWLATGRFNPAGPTNAS